MSQQPEEAVCSHCGFHNDAEATRCARCGKSLRGGTIPVPVFTPSGEHVPSADSVSTVKLPGIALWVRHHDVPILIENTTGALLGRRTERDTSVSALLVDLNDYHAYRLGVSRRHAQMQTSEEGWVIMDLGSSNGTWVNGLRLQPYQPAVLRGGDRINLAQLELTVSPITDEAREAASNAGPFTGHDAVDDQDDASEPTR